MTALIAFKFRRHIPLSNMTRNFREFFSGHLTGINFRELGFTKDFEGIDFRELGLFKDSSTKISRFVLRPYISENYFYLNQGML